MSHRGAVLVITLALGACAGSNERSSVDSRADGLVMDGGPGQDGMVFPDVGPLPDMTVGDLTCVETLMCWGDCQGDEACEEACLLEGTADAQRQISDLTLCTANAKTITCEPLCANPSSAECSSCVHDACETEFHYCLFGYGILPGFGDTCDTDQVGCPEPQACISAAGGTQGFCTAPCEGEELCVGPPVGTYAQCLLEAEGGERFCGFVCKKGSTEYDCPAQLICSTTEIAPGSGVHLCVEPM